LSADFEKDITEANDRYQKRKKSDDDFFAALMDGDSGSEDEEDALKFAVCGSTSSNCMGGLPIKRPN
jgi:hypothetical protein